MSRNTHTDGDCYAAAATYLMEAPDEPNMERWLVHGIVTGTGGPHKGQRFGHAWVEECEGDVWFVVDKANGKDHCVPRSMYYAIGQIDGEATAIYSSEDMIHKLVSTQHWGPWEKGVSATEYEARIRAEEETTTEQGEE